MIYGDQKWEITKLEDMVPSLSRCIKLKEAGYAQGHSYFIWCGKQSETAYVLPRRERSSLVPTLCDAPTVTEIVQRGPASALDLRNVSSPDGIAARWLELHIIVSGGNP